MDNLEDINAKTRRAYDLAAQTYHDLFHDEMKEKAYDRELLDGFAARFEVGAVICDAGCGPSAHIGRYLAAKGLDLIGVDLSERCASLARRYNPGMKIICGDIGNLPFASESLDGVLSYYAIIDTPKVWVNRLFEEFHRVLKPGGSLIVAVKEGRDEGFVQDLLGIEIDIYFALFTESEIRAFFVDSGFALDFLELRNPYDFEIANQRIFAIGKRTGS
jgi:SAM-dependent methyltransferase